MIEIREKIQGTESLGPIKCMPALQEAFEAKISLKIAPQLPESEWSPSSPNTSGAFYDGAIPRRPTCSPV